MCKEGYFNISEAKSPLEIGTVYSWAVFRFLTLTTPALSSSKPTTTAQVAPTASSARYFNGLETPGFFRRSSIVRYSEKALQREVSVIEAFAGMEGLAAHGRSGTIRVKRF